MSNITDVTSGTGTVSLPNHLCSVPFLWGPCCLSLVFCLVFCGPFLCVFVFLLLSLYCLFSFKLRFLITLLYLQTVFLFSILILFIKHHLTAKGLMVYNTIQYKYHTMKIIFQYKRQQQININNNGLRITSGPFQWLLCNWNNERHKSSINRFNPHHILCLSKARTLILNVIYVQWLEVIGDC